mgnify:CR=1 FL=1
MSEVREESFYYQAEDGIRDSTVNGVQKCLFRSSRNFRSVEIYFGVYIECLYDFRSC